MPIKPRCCNPFSCFSAVEKRPDPTPAGAQTAPSGRILSFMSLNVSGAAPCINEASTSGSSNVPNRSEEQDVDFNLNVSGDSRCINEAPTCSSSSGATKSRSDLISSIRKDIVEVEDVNLDDLMNHISELFKLREEGKQQQASNLRKFLWPNVPGLQKLKEIVSFGTDLQKLQNMLSAALTVGSELVCDEGTYLDQRSEGISELALDMRCKEQFKDKWEMRATKRSCNVDLDVVSLCFLGGEIRKRKRMYVKSIGIQ